MIYNFETSNENEAMAALIVYGCYKSRDTNKFKVTPDMWGVIERAVKSCAKRSVTLQDFIEKFKLKVSCSSIRPDFMMSHTESKKIMIEDGTGGFITKEETGGRTFWTNIIQSARHEECMNELYYHSSFIIVLVRERLEREKQLQEIGGNGNEI